jgi:hypothetical protein
MAASTGKAESSAFIQNTQAGQFGDGSEATKQVQYLRYIYAKEQLRLWATDSGDEESD